MKQITKVDYSTLTGLNVKMYEAIASEFKNRLIADSARRKYVTDESITWNGNGMSVVQIQCNEVGIANDVLRNNDWMVTVVDNKVREVYKITTDPKTKRSGMAFIVPQVTRRHVGYHHWNLNRIALRQDQGSDFDYTTWVRRFYYKNGKWTWTEQKGFFTIHTHDTGGFWNSSLGCAVIANDKTYQVYFKPALKDLKKRKLDRNIPLYVINDKEFIKIANDLFCLV